MLFLITKKSMEKGHKDLHCDWSHSLGSTSHHVKMEHNLSTGLFRQIHNRLQDEVLCAPRRLLDRQDEGHNQSVQAQHLSEDKDEDHADK